jgi:hypothetical protein
VPCILSGSAIARLEVQLDQLVGGMPAAVELFASQRSLLPVADLKGDLLATLRDDFAKYANRVHHRRLTAVLDSVPAQLGQKFTYAKVDRDERSAALKQALDLLTLARVCHRVVSTPGHGIPLGAGGDTKTFKVLYLDVSLASTAMQHSAFHRAHGDRRLQQITSGHSASPSALASHFRYSPGRSPPEGDANFARPSTHR